MSSGKWQPSCLSLNVLMQEIVGAKLIGGQDLAKFWPTYAIALNHTQVQRSFKFRLFNLFFS